MLKEALKRDFGVYCDTDKLVDDCMALLTKYHHDNTEDGVCRMLRKYFIQKKSLIDLFMQSENYIGDMRICLHVEMERRNNSEEVMTFCHDFSHKVEAKQIFLKYIDDNGKTYDDYARTGIRKFKARSLYRGSIQHFLTCNPNKTHFCSDGSTVESNHELYRFNSIINMFGYNPQSILSTALANDLQQNKINARFVGGMKTGRAFNRVCECYGVDKLPNYNKLFAQYSDMVSGLKRKMYFYISLNPLDYLTMSFGNSWSSCHTIDKLNERNMQNGYRGMHAGGTVSYMLDRTSIVTYVHNHKTNDYEEGKIYRNMFHFSEGTLIQGRIYPQGNDGATDLYREFRRIVQMEFTKLLELDEDEWIRRKGDCYDNTVSTGVHYCDYLNFSECNVSYPREMPGGASEVVAIGHERICPNCGRAIDDAEDSGLLVHSDCQCREDDDFDF